MRGLGLGLSLTGRASAFTPLSVSPKVWLDPSDLTTMYQSGTRGAPGTAVAADGDPVGLILDKSGNNLDFTASGSARPLYKTSGGLRWLLFDGTDDILTGAAFSQSAPYTRMLAARHVAYTAVKYMLDGGADNECILQQGGGPVLGLYAGAGPIGDNSALATTAGADLIIETKVNGASSRIRVDAQAANTGNAGSNALTGQRVGGGAGTFSNIRVHSLIIGVFSDAQVDQLRTYMAATYQGRVLA